MTRSKECERALDRLNELSHMAGDGEEIWANIQVLEAYIEELEKELEKETTA